MADNEYDKLIDAVCAHLAEKIKANEAMMGLKVGDQVKVINDGDDPDLAHFVGQIGVIREQQPGFTGENRVTYPSLVTVVFASNQEDIFEPKQLEKQS